MSAGALPGWPSDWMQGERESFPEKYADADLDFSVPIACAIDPTVDFISSVSVAIAPSGTGELAIQSVAVADNVITIFVSGGQPRRRYTYKLIATMLDGRTFVWREWQDVPPFLPTDVPQPLPSPGFGAAIVWQWAPTLNFGDPRNSMYLL